MSRMLIADDQAGIRLMLAQVFQNLGIEVDTANLWLAIAILHVLGSDGSIP